MQNFDYIIDVRHITKSYRDNTVLNDINLSVRKGEFVTILGPSGCGKTTLLRLISGFLPATAGEILIAGHDVTGIPPYRRPVNTVFQKYALFPHLNVFDNIAFGLKLKKMPKQEIIRKVSRVLKMVSMTDYEYRSVNSLSGGQQQRVAIARAIVNEPEVLLLDEPLAALDLKMRKDMQMELKELHRNLNITFLYVTHDQEEALTLSDTVVVMSDGVIQQIGPPTDVYNEPVNSFVADFIGASNILNAVMLRDERVSFAGHDFDCVDKGFGENTEVDVVVRPEDINLSSEITEKSFTGKVMSKVFKGVHNEMTLLTPEGFEFLVHDYHSFEIGTNLAMSVDPFDIHVMKKERTYNTFEGRVIDGNHVEFIGNEFECPPIEGKNPGDTVTVRVDFNGIELLDNEGVTEGQVKYILYKGDRYHLSVKTDSGDYVYVDTQDVWDDDDQVGISIPADKIRII